MTKALTIIIQHTAADPQVRRDETLSLIRAALYQAVCDTTVRLREPRAATYITPAAIEMIDALVQTHEPDVIIVDDSLTGVQQRQLQRAWDCTVLDRPGLILRIFLRRASSRIAKLQVRRAQLAYQRTRLVREWTHLERQRAVSFIGGPGETQLEIDRRLLDQKIDKIDAQLQSARRTRQLNRQVRRHLPSLALVGYTNAGKSSLFNLLTSEKRPSRNQVFTTLDSATRKISGTNVTITDTIGFISELPPQLVNAFHATLEEVTQADVILHVHDIASPAREDHDRDVTQILQQIGVNAARQPIIDVWNKIDLLPDKDHAILLRQAKQAGAIALSTRSQQGLDDLHRRLTEVIERSWQKVSLRFEASRGDLWSFLHSKGRVTAYRRQGKRLYVTARLDVTSLGQLQDRFQDVALRVHL
ncbi:MAG: GTPase HflX [Pseudomonadota bacterium]